MPTIRWPNKETDTAPTWTELLKNLQRVQMTPTTGWGLRRQMAIRARRWSGARIPTVCSARAFFAHLADAGMVDILDGEEQTT